MQEHANIEYAVVRDIIDIRVPAIADRLDVGPRETSFLRLECGTGGSEGGGRNLQSDLTAVTQHSNR